MAATPDGFIATSARLRLGPPNGFTAQAFRDRFFSGGPTDVQQLLTSVDDRITEVERLRDGQPARVRRSRAGRVHPYPVGAE